MGRPAVLAIKVVADAKQAQAELKGTGSAVKRTGDTLGKMALPAAAALGAVTAFGKSAVSAASDVEQSFGGLEAVFGKQSDAVKKLAQGADKATGLATSDYAQMAAVIGAQLKGMGTAQKDLVPSTKNLISLGADLAATYGGTTADAVSAVSSLLRGETDPIEKYGVSINAARIKAEMAAKGLDKLTGAAKTQAEAQVKMSLLTKDTAAAQGQFAAQTNTTAEQQQIAAAQYKNAQAALGQALLPAVTAVTKALGAFAGWAQKNTGLVQALAAVVVVIAGSILALNVAMKVAAVATKAWAVAQKILNLAMKMNPLGLIITLVALLVVGLVMAYRKSETFRRIVDGAMRGVLAAVKAVAAWIQKYLGPIMEIGFKAASKAAQVMWNVISVVFDAIKSGVSAVNSVISTIAGAIRTVIDLIKRIHIPKVPSWVPGFGGRSVPPAVASSAAGMRATRRATATGRPHPRTGGGGAPIVINVNGALDPDGVARQIRNLLGRADIRNGSRIGVTSGWVTPVTG